MDFPIRLDDDDCCRFDVSRISEKTWVAQSGIEKFTKCFKTTRLAQLAQNSQNCDGFSGSRSTISHSHLKVILYCFLPDISPLINLNENRMKNAEVEKIRYWSASVSWLGW